MGWRRWYMALLALRLYFALQPSYIHPDEHFQGPEVIAGEIFNWPTFKTWEFTSEAPIRSFFPLWFIYGIPMQILDWVTPGLTPPRPIVTFYVLRLLFFLASFVLEDWALQDLAANPRQRAKNLLLLASSYVTWTYQTHTFSNATETITVLWSLVLIGRISKSRTNSLMPSALLGFIVIFGVFNRITFPAFLILPSLRLIPHFLRHPLSFITLTAASLITAVYAIYLDTLFYNPSALSSANSVFSLWHFTPVITPLNNILYNTRTENLALHGLHPRYTHLLANLPQLVGPALLTIAFSIPSSWRSLMRSGASLSALGGVGILSFMPHQEARFLIPAVPLLLTVTPTSLRPIPKQIFLALWIVFNLAFGVLMGCYHQAGVVPAQAWLGELQAGEVDNVVYWKTYSPPSWLLGTMNEKANLTDLMGAPVKEMVKVMDDIVCRVGAESKGDFLVAPLSAVKLDPYVENDGGNWRLEEAKTVRRHLNMDDLDIGEEGLAGTWKRVVGRRGLRIWRVVRKEGACEKK